MFFIYFFIASDTSDEYLDIQKLNGTKIGHLRWSLDKLKIALNYKDNMIGVYSNNNNSNNNEDDRDQLEFRYYSGLKLNRLLARSISLRVLFTDDVVKVNSQQDEFVTFRITGIYI